jgi:hypothetical protein
MYISNLQRIVATTDWLLEALHQCDRAGFAHSWSPLFRWKAAYPETTGYLIPTLLRLHEVAEIRTHYAAQSIDLQNIALSQAEWLCTLQLENGAFPGLLVGSKKPSVFNTGMILFGLSAEARLLKTQAQSVTPTANFTPFSTSIQTSLDAAIRYLFTQMDHADGLWRKDTYQADYSPCYHVYALSGLLEAVAASGVLPAQKEAWTADINKVLGSYLAYQMDNGFFRDCGFASGQPAFTHTLAYTLQGIWNVGCALEHIAAQKAVIKSLEALMQTHQKHKKLAGTYGPDDWNGDYSFKCVTGNAQLAILCYQVSDQTVRPDLWDFGDQIMSEIYPAQQIHSTWWQMRGAVPGSMPLWGKYMRMRYPNWAAKYWLDAVMAAERMKRP